jgi:hypothetical protein
VVSRGGAAFTKKQPAITPLELIVGLAVATHAGVQERGGAAPHKLTAAAACRWALAELRLELDRKLDRTRDALAAHLTPLAPLFPHASSGQFATSPSERWTNPDQGLGCNLGAVIRVAPSGGLMNPRPFLCAAALASALLQPLIALAADLRPIVRLP